MTCAGWRIVLVVLTALGRIDEAAESWRPNGTQRTGSNEEIAVDSLARLSGRAVDRGRMHALFMDAPPDPPVDRLVGTLKSLGLRPKRVRISPRMLYSRNEPALLRFVGADGAVTYAVYLGGTIDTAEFAVADSPTGATQMSRRVADLGDEWDGEAIILAAEDQGSAATLAYVLVGVVSVAVGWAAASRMRRRHGAVDGKAPSR